MRVQASYDRQQRRAVWGLRFLIYASAWWLLAACRPSVPTPENVSEPSLEESLKLIDEELQELARYSFRGGVGAIGYRSEIYRESMGDELPWIEIDLEGEHVIDEIVIVPNITRDTSKQFRADGFPTEFEVWIGRQGDPVGRKVAEFFQEDALLPRVAPVVIELSQTEAAWVKLLVNEVPQTAFGELRAQLSEVMVFSGSRNVALRKTVKTANFEPAEYVAVAWRDHFLVDGHTPYLMYSGRGERSISFLSVYGTQNSLVLDLGEPYPITQINLYPVEQGDTYPQAYVGDLGIPRNLKIEGASEADFSDSTLLIDNVVPMDYLNIGPVMSWYFSPKTCRYIRISNDVTNDSEKKYRDARIGFAEIEVFSDSENIALGKRVERSNKSVQTARSLVALTDGSNFFGEIIPVRQWMTELARRHDLERKRVLVEAQLERDIQELNQRLWVFACVSAGVVLVVVSVLLKLRFDHLAELKKLRLRIAADLHDELGTNLHVIGMMSDLINRDRHSPEKISRMHQNIRSMTDQTSSAVKYCTKIAESEELYQDLLNDMRRFAVRIFGDIDYQFSAEGEAVLRELPASVRIDLFLFYKECLVNISRHSKATECCIQIKADTQLLVLIVEDNGCGLERLNPRECVVPRSLKRRVRFLGAQVEATPREPEGTRIKLVCPVRRKRFFELFNK